MLKTVIVEKYRRSSTESAAAILRDYVFAMTILGNDFIPHGLSLSLKGDGYRRLEHFLKDKERPPLVTEDETWNRPGLAYLFSYFAKIEPALIFEEIGSKEKARHARVLYGDDENAAWARAYSDWMRTPIKRMDEYALLKINKQTLAENWRDTYYYAWFGTKSGTQQNNTIVNTYIDGLYWVLDYYTGRRSVDPLWYYPWNLPPLMCDLEKASRDYVEVVNAPAEKPISPVEQCALVMPAVSMHLCADRRFREIPSALPHYFPTTAKFFYVGKRHMWECEPLIPILTIKRLRSLLA
jgi:5'-3' exonuclease